MYIPAELVIECKDAYKVKFDPNCLAKPIEQNLFWVKRSEIYDTNDIISKSRAEYKNAIMYMLDKMSGNDWKEAFDGLTDIGSIIRTFTPEGLISRVNKFINSNNAFYGQIWKLKNPESAKDGKCDYVACLGKLNGNHHLDYIYFSFNSYIYAMPKEEFFNTYEFTGAYSENLCCLNGELTQMKVISIGKETDESNT